MPRTEPTNQEREQPLTREAATILHTVNAHGIPYSAGPMPTRGTVI